MINTIQLLRAVACLLIVSEHLVPILELNPSFLKGVMQDAAFATDMFFIISGFIMWHITMRREHDAVDFLVRRVIRIVPLYWILTLVYVAAFILPSVAAGRLPFDLAHILASLAFIPYENPALHAVAPVIVPGHVLQHYIYFYVLFAAALALFASPTKRFVAIAAVIVAAAAAGLVLDASPEVEFVLKATIVEFVIGMALAALAARLAPTPVLAAAAAATLVAALLSLALASALIEPAPAIVRLFVFGLPAAGVVLAAVLYETGRRPTCPPLVTAVAAASFSIYLTHIFTQTLVRIAWTTLHLPADGLWAVPYVAAAFVLSVVVGILTYHAVEQPLCNALVALWERHQARRATRRLAPVAGCGAERRTV